MKQFNAQAKLLEMEYDGLRQSAFHYGDSRHDLIILLHGFPDTPNGWNDVAPSLAHAGYQVLTPWLRGYTHGSAKMNKKYDIVTVAADIAAWIHMLNPAQKVYVVGHDWGAFIAQVLAIKYPHLVKEVVLLSVPPLPNLTKVVSLLLHNPRQIMMSSYVFFVQMKTSPKVLGLANAYLIKLLWKKWSPDWSFTEKNFSHVSKIFSDHQMAWAVTRYYKSLFTLQDINTREFYKLVLSPMKMPFLVIAGENDGCLNIKLLNEISEKSLFKETKFLIMKKCGHFLQHEQPELLTELIINNLAKA